MTTITDQYMKESIAKAKSYILVLLKAGPEFNSDYAKHAIWEHGRRNFELRAKGILPIVCPVADDSELCSVGILIGTVDDATKTMDADPGVMAGVFIYELHPCRSFPGDKLP
jgi:hypothetical protein